MAGKPNPIQLQKHLSGVDYPASRDDLVKAAREHGADRQMVEALQKIPDRTYDGPNAVSKPVSGNGWGTAPSPPRRRAPSGRPPSRGPAARVPGAAMRSVSPRPRSGGPAAPGPATGVLPRRA